jgi:transcription-repair coupling factor (superfamily II helicase)
MVGFVGGRYDLLLCTTIIESGLDLPNVNTLIVNNAHAFGLAQLYQIRGRVGRGHRQAYAYFVVPPTETLPTEARLRLATLAKFTSVGSGLHVASIDMELRGAGDILGADQSGQVNAVGFEVYVHLLHDEVDRLKARQEQVPQRVECQVDVAADVAVPEEYIADRHQRLVFYRMAATAETPEAVERLRFETRDRFGPMPESVSRLLSVAEIRVRAGQLAISRLEVVGGTVRAHIGSCPDNVLQGVLALIREQPLPVRLTPDHVLHADLSKLGAPDPVARARRFLNTLERAVVGR